MSLTHFLLLLMTLMNPGPTQDDGDAPKDHVLQGRPFALWVKDLKSTEPAKRIPAIAVVGLLGPKAKETIPLLSLAARDRDVAVRVVAVEALGRIGPDDLGLVALLTAEADPNPDVRRIARAVLTRWFPTLKERVAALLKAAENRQTQGVARNALFRLGPADGEAIPVIVECITKGSDLRANLATTILQRMGPAAKDAVPALLPLLEPTADLRLRVRALSTLGAIQLEAHRVVPALTKLLTAPNLSQGEKSLVMRTLGNFESAARSALPMLHTAMADKDEGLRMSAAEAILRIDPRDARPIPIFVTLLRKGSPGQRVQAAQRLMQLGPAAKAAAHDLGEALADSDPQVVYLVASILLRFGKDAKPAQAALLKAAKHAFPEVRVYALRALVNLQPTEPEAVDQLLAQLVDADLQMRQLANQALAAARAQKGGAQAQYRKQFTQADPHLRKEAFAFALSDERRSAELIEVLLELLKHERVDIRRETARNLGTSRNLAHADLVPRLKEATHDTDERVRTWAAIALSHASKQEQAIPLLLAALRHPEAEVRTAVRVALHDYGPAAKGALPVYREWLKSLDANDNVQGAMGITALGDEAKATLPDLSDAIAKRPATRRYLLPFLHRFGADAKPALPGIQEAARLGRDEDRLEAALVWWKIDPTGQEPRTILEEFTRHRQVRLRDRAEEALGKRRLKFNGHVIPDPSLPKEPAALRKLLQDDDPQICEHALVALGQQRQLRHPDVLAALPRLARPPAQRNRTRYQTMYERLRYQALRSMPLADPDGAKMVPVLQEFLSDGEDGTRRIAVECLGNYGAKAKAALPRLKAVLHDAPAEVQIAAAQAVWQIDPACTEGIGVLINLSQQSGPGSDGRAISWCQMAVAALGRFGPDAAPAVPHLIRLLDDDRLKVTAIRVLSQIGTPAKAALPDLRRVMRRTDARDRLSAIYAADAVWKLDPPAQDALAALLNAFRNVPAGQTSDAALILGSLGPRAGKDVVPLLIDALRDTEGQQLIAIIEALGKFGDQAAPAIPLLEPRLKMPVFDGVAATALLRIDAKHPLALAFYRRALADERSRFYTLQALASLGSPARGLLPELKQLARSPDESIRWEALIAWIKIDPPRKLWWGS